MDDIFMIVLGDEILDWGPHDSVEGVLQAFFALDASKMGPEFCRRTFEYEAILDDSITVTSGVVYHLIHAPSEATSLVEATKSLKAVSKRHLCANYYRLVRTVARREDHDDNEIDTSYTYVDLDDDCELEGPAAPSFASASTSMAVVGSYETFVFTDRGTIH